MKEPKRYYCGNGEGMFEDDKNGHWVQYSEHKAIVDALTKQLRKHDVSGSFFDWDKFANALKDEFGESLVEEDGGEEDAYNWWLTDVTVTDIVEFIKNYR